MSEVEQQVESVLLPSARVVVFSNDKHTLDVMGSLRDDWRYARVDVIAHEIGADRAAAVMESMPSVDLMIVQTETIDEGFTAQLEELSHSCEEGTAAIVVGPVNDVGLYRTLIDMGVSDYLVAPVPKEVLSKVIARTLIDRKGVRGSRLVSFIGAKGGVGASSVLRANAWCSSEMMMQKTAVLDVAGGWSGMSVGFGYEPSSTLSEAVKALHSKDADSFSRMMVPLSDNLSALAVGGDVMLDSLISPQELEVILDEMMAKYPVVLADLSHAPVELAKALIVRSHQVQVVSNATPVSLRLARTLLHEISEVSGGRSDIVQLVINMFGQSPSYEVGKADIANAMGVDVAALLSYAPQIFMAAENEGARITKNGDGLSLVETQIRPLLQKIVKDKGAPVLENAKGQGILERFLNQRSAK